MALNALQAGQEPPDSAQDNLWPICLAYYTAWSRLHWSRYIAIGMGGAVPQGLLYSEIAQFAKDMGHAPCRADLEDFVHLVYVLDTTYLEWVRANAPK